MVQVYQIEKTGGVWVLLTKEEFEIIFERYHRGLVHEDDKDIEARRVTKALNWISKVVQGEESAVPFSGATGSPKKD